MKIDSRDVPEGTRLDTDVCVVGAGPAGISLATELERAGIDVCLLESGGFVPTSAADELNAGSFEGTLNSPRWDSYLQQSRSRRFGGTTDKWGGWCRPLDPLDFEKRAWVRWSGWPFPRAHLDEEYRRGAELIGIHPFDDELPPSAGLLGATQSRLVTKLFHCRATRFGDAFREKVIASTKVRLFLHSTVLELVPNADVTRVEHLEVAGRGGSRFSIRPRVTVLAAGAVENARMLLLSDRFAAGGLGNQHDLVGRFYMEHPHCLAADLLFFDPKRDLSRFEVYREPKFGHVVARAILIAEETQRAERLLNFRAYLGPSIPDPPVELEPDIIRSASRLARVLGLRGMAPRAKTRAFRLRVSGEQAPDPESRISLANERDRFGARKVNLNWRLSRADLRSVQRSLEIVGEEVGRALVGRLHLRLDDERGWPNMTWGGHHHMGTTRMHRNPRQGVVDADAQVHGIGNFYITGGSVFPAGGVANPTLTIVALSVRLAKHIAARFQSGR